MFNIILHIFLKFLAFFIFEDLALFETAYGQIGTSNIFGPDNTGWDKPFRRRWLCNRACPHTQLRLYFWDKPHTIRTCNGQCDHVHLTERNKK